MDVSGGSAPDVAGTQLKARRPGRQEHLPLDHHPLTDGDADTGQIVVVETGSLTAHPGQRPYVEPVILVHQPVPATRLVGDRQSLPQPSQARDAICQRTELIQIQVSGVGGDEFRHRGHHGLGWGDHVEPLLRFEPGAGAKYRWAKGRWMFGAGRGHSSKDTAGVRHG